MTNEIGRQIGRFRLLAVLGSGGFATVYRAEDTQLGREVALKLLHPHLAGDEAFRRRFLAEARAIARLHHPQIVAIHEVGETDDGRPYLVMPMLEGTLLSDVIARRAPLPAAETEAIVRQLASALDYLHSQGIVHRDLKPSNVMTTAGGSVTLMDFGIARSAEEQARLTQTGQMVGTPTYMAPEQISGEESGPAGDIYSLGIVAYELFAGRPPFTGNPTAVMRAQIDAPPPPIAGFNPNVPPAAALAIDRTLAKDPAVRPPTATAFADLLAGEAPTEVFARGVAPAVVPLPGAYPPVAPPARSYTWVIVASALVALIILALLILVFARRGGSPSPAPTTAARQPLVSPTALSAATAVTATPAPTATAAPSATATPRATPTPSPSPTPTPSPAPTPSPTQPPTPSPSPVGSQTPDNGVAAVLGSLPAPASAAFVDVTPNTETSQAGQTPVPAGDTALLLIGEAVEEAVQQGRLASSQQFTIQPADAAGSRGTLASQVGRGISVRNLLQAALVNSDPVAANVLIRALGGINSLNSEAQRLQLSQTRLVRGFSTQTLGGPSDNVTSTGDLAQLMAEIAAHRGVDPAAADDLQAFLRLRDTQSPSAAGGGLPRGSVVAAIDAVGQSGSLSVALLTLPNGRLGSFAIAIPGAARAAADPQIAAIAKQVVQAFGP